MDLSRHPIHFLDFLRARPDAQRLKLQFVTYSYKEADCSDPSLLTNVLKQEESYSKKSSTQDREYFWMDLSSVNQTWLEGVLGGLPHDETFGFTGRVQRRTTLGHEENFFVPTLDFVLRHARPSLLGKLLHHFDFDESVENVEAVLYTTDNSFHAYFSTLLPIADLPKFLGEALLFNERGDTDEMVDEHIDTRWVGNSLMRGFATLRWSLKHTAPKALPTLAPGFPSPSFLATKATPEQREGPILVEDDIPF